MRKALVLVSLLGLAGTAFADVEIQDLLARRQGSKMNIRVTVNNPTGMTQKGPVKVRLFARQTATDSWVPLKTWTDISKIAPKNRVSRDFFDENSATLKDMAMKGAFEVRATAEAPGASRVAERTYSWHDTNQGH